MDVLTKLNEIKILVKKIEESTKAIKIEIIKEEFLKNEQRISSTVSTNSKQTR